MTGSYADDTPAEYSSIVAEASKDEDDKAKKVEIENKKNAEDKSKAAAK